MLKVNEFERAVDARSNRAHLYAKDANVEYTYDGTETDLMQDLQSVSNYIKHHVKHQRPRLKILSDYYEAKTKNIVETTRRKEKHMADNRVGHDYASYISDFVNGYFLGNPIQFQDDNDEVVEVMESFNDLNDIESHNRSMGLDLSIYGRAYELMIRNQSDETRVYKSNVLNTFIIYDNTVERNSLMGIRYLNSSTLNADEQVINVDLYTSQGVYRFYTSEQQGWVLFPKENNFEYHAFERVPITEFSNNERRKGDYEKVIPLFDLYDNAQSDTANYMSDLNDALLMLKGNLDLTPEEAQKQKKANVLFLEPTVYEDVNGNSKEGSVDGEYIYKQYDVAGTEAYKTRIDNDIHMFTNTPNMKDDNFSGTTSGEAMKYKLFGLEQRTKNKEGLFVKGLRRRAKLLETITRNTTAKRSDLDFYTVRYIFNRNLPKSIVEELQAYMSAGGEISKTTLMSLFSIFQDPELEMEKLQKESDEERKNSDDRGYSDAFDDKQEKNDVDD